MDETRLPNTDEWSDLWLTAGYLGLKKPKHKAQNSYFQLVTEWLHNGKAGRKTAAPADCNVVCQLPPHCLGESLLDYGYVISRLSPTKYATLPEVQRTGEWRLDKCYPLNNVIELN